VRIRNRFFAHLLADDMQPAQERIGVAKISLIRHTNQNWQHQEGHGGLPQFHDVRRGHLEDDGHPDVGGYGERGGDVERRQVLDDPRLARGDNPNAHSDDNQQVESSRADDRRRT